MRDVDLNFNIGRRAAGKCYIRFGQFHRGGPMSTLRESVRDFLASDRIAVVGVSRDPNGTANLIYRKLKSTGASIFPVNPAATTVEGDTCYSSIEAIPGGVGSAMLVTRPEVTDRVMEECVRLRIGHVWMHRLMGQGSVSKTAVVLGRQNGISVIDGACPMMFVEPVDPAHRCMRWLLGATHALPRGD
jgi:uncharacterized protein